MDRRPRRTEELDRLIDKARADLREWADAAADDPGKTLLELLAHVGDTLSHYADRMENESYVGDDRRRPGLRVEVDGQRWSEVPSLDASGPDDGHYVVTVGDDGATAIAFGDGVHGRRPPASGSIRVGFRPERRYASVQVEQGRVILDEDWTEAAARTCGIYRAIVVDAVDPLGKLRLRVEVPEVSGGETHWAMACVPAGATVNLPSAGDPVWVAFEACDPARPIWLGRAIA